MIKKEDIKFSPHRLGDLMTEGRGKNESIGATCEAYLREVKIFLTTGRKKIVKSKFLTKGIECEQQGLTLMCERFGIYLPYIEEKDKKKLYNAWIHGTPDYVPTGSVFERFGIIDIKNSWDIFTFDKSSYLALDKNYYWQMQGYMDLTGADKSTVVFTLVNTPAELFEKELKNLQYEIGIHNPNYDEIFEKSYKQLQLNHNFDDLPVSRRVSAFRIDRVQEDIDRIRYKCDLGAKWIIDQIQRDNSNFEF